MGSLPYMVIEKAGIINLDDFYRTMRKWFEDNFFFFDEGLTRIRTGSAAGVEYEWKWLATRKVNEYAKFEIKLFFHLFDVQDLDVIKEGQKVKLTKCRLRLEINSTVVTDYNKIFSKGKFAKYLGEIYKKFVLKEEKVIGHWEDELHYRVFKFQTVVKEYLDMEAKGNAYYDVW